MRPPPAAADPKKPPAGRGACRAEAGKPPTKKEAGEKTLEEAPAANTKANEACVKAGASYIVLGAAATATIAALF